jgi:soluble lytic murein transglycosylase-like protein
MGVRFRLVPAVVTVVALSLVACGSDGGGADSARPGPGSDAGGATTTSTTAPVGSSPSPDKAPPPRDAADAARRITAIERALRDPATPSARLDPLGWEQQIVYRSLASHEDWLDAVVAAVPADVATIVRANAGSGSSLSKLVDPPTALPADWHIVVPEPAAALLGYYREAEAASGIPWSYLAAINLVETRMGRIVGDSTAGAQGPMQFIPSTWAAYGRGGDVHDPRASILAAGRYLQAAGGPSKMDKALFAYNHSDAYVDAVKRYASVLAADERAFAGYHAWQVLYRTVDGLYLLPEGYPQVPAVRLG